MVSRTICDDAMYGGHRVVNRVEDEERNRRGEEKEKPMYNKQLLGFTREDRQRLWVVVGCLVFLLHTHKYTDPHTPRNLYMHRPRTEDYVATSV